MTAPIFKFTLDPKLDMDDAESTLHLALFSVEGLYGGARMRTEASYQRLIDEHAIFVDAATDVGRSLVQVFTNLLSREFGENAFRVERVEAEAVGEGKS